MAHFITTTDQDVVKKSKYEYNCIQEKLITCNENLLIYWRKTKDTNKNKTVPTSIFSKMVAQK